MLPRAGLDVVAKRNGLVSARSQILVVQHWSVTLLSEVACYEYTHKQM